MEPGQVFKDTIFKYLRLTDSIKLASLTKKWKRYIYEILGKNKTIIIKGIMEINYFTLIIDNVEDVKIKPKRNLIDIFNEINSGYDKSHYYNLNDYFRVFSIDIDYNVLISTKHAYEMLKLICWCNQNKDKKR